MRPIACLTTVIFALAWLPVSAEDLQTVVSERVRMPLVYQLDGVVEARQRATLSAEVAGKIEAVYFDVDDYVEPGSVVLRIRDREYRAVREQARAALAEADANLREMQLDFRRNQDLRKQKLISQAVFDRSSASLKAAEARQAAAAAALARAEEQLGYTVVKAPYGGVVVERHVEPGESVNPGQPIMTGYALGSLRVNADVPQSLIEDGRKIEVEKITIHPFADARSHAFPVRLDLPEIDDGLFPGMLVKVALTIGETDRLLLPQAALISRAEVNAVYIVAADGRVSLRQVRPGNRYDDRIEILAGLDAGESVALDPVRAGIEHKRQQESDL